MNEEIRKKLDRMRDGIAQDEGAKAETHMAVLSLIRQSECKDLKRVAYAIGWLTACVGYQQAQIDTLREAIKQKVEESDESNKRHNDTR